MTTTLDGWQRGAHVQLTKHTVLSADGTLYDTGYWARGNLLANITVGAPITMLRYARAPQEPTEPGTVERIGIFTSTPVERVEGDLVYTRNSVWHVEALEPIPVTHTISSLPS